MEAEGEVQFRGRREGIGWRLERIEVRRAGELSPRGQNRIRMERVSLSQGLFEEVRMKQLSGRRIKGGR